MGFLNRTGAEMGYSFDKKNAIKSFFIIEEIQKYRKYPALDHKGRPLQQFSQQRFVNAARSGTSSGPWPESSRTGSCRSRRCPRGPAPSAP